jgi:activator of 2-hydroxyglutaryl-CoA dehydratase
MAVVAGVDIGAGTAKTVILSERQIVSCCFFPPGMIRQKQPEKHLMRRLKRPVSASMRLRRLLLQVTVEISFRLLIGQ